MNTQVDTNNNEATIVDRARETAAQAYDTTRKTAQDAAHTTVDTVESNPIAALVGGIAVGVALGALLPKTQAETQHLGPIGKRLTDTAAAAARAARDQGRQELSALVPDKDNAKEKASSVLSAVVQAAKDGGKTAA